MLDTPMNQKIADEFKAWLNLINPYAHLAYERFLPSVQYAVDILREAHACRASFMIVTNNEIPTVISRIQLMSDDGKFTIDPYNLLKSTIDIRFSKLRHSKFRYLIYNTGSLAKHLEPTVKHLYAGLQQDVDRMVDSTLKNKASHGGIQSKLDAKREALRQKEIENLRRTFMVYRHLTFEDVVTVWNELTIQRVIET